MPSAKTNLTIKGFEEAVAKLANIADKKQMDRRINAAFKKAALPIVEIAKSKAPVDTGALRKSIILNSKKLRNGNRSVRIGPQTGFVGDFVGTEKKGGQISFRKPSKYAHLVEYGYTLRNGKKKRRKPFMRPAAARAGGQTFINKAAELLGKSYARLAKQKGVSAVTSTGGGKILPDVIK